MKHIKYVAWLWMLIGWGSSMAQGLQYHPKRILVKFTEQSFPIFDRKQTVTHFNIPELDALNARHGFIRAERLYKGNVHGDKDIGKAEIIRIYLFYYSDSISKFSAVEEYMRLGYFEYVELDYLGHAAAIFPDDPEFDRQWYLYNDGSFGLANSKEDADIDMELAWEKQTGNSSVILAFLDSGTKLDHPEFQNRLWENKLEVPNNGKDDDHNGYMDDFYGFDFAYGDPDPTDDHWHGTAMAGLAAANGNNGTGYAGVDWNCRIMSCKVLEADGFGYYSAWSEAIFYAVDNGADVINMSLGGTSSSDLLKDGIKYAEANMVMVVAAMGNDDSDQLNFPAAIDDCFAVGATDPDDSHSRPFVGTIGTGTNHGQHIDVVAPGNFMYILDHTNELNYNLYAGGTSLATALVSGVASLLKAQDATRTPEDIRTILRNSAQDLVGSTGIDVTGWDSYYGYGRINASAALSESISSETKVLTEGISVFPNPTDGEFKLVFRIFQDTDVEIAFYNRIGALVRTPILFSDLKAGTYNQSFTIGNFDSGVYHFKFTHDEGVEVQKIIVY
ncbi:MAG: S8 family serine peptidase [Flavobacteriales bacterium]|nr:S8 family serine peptidase [Flavobacteriales bacterium]